MADTFPVRIIRERYVYGGRSIPVGSVVQVTEAQFRSMTRMSPPYAERVEPAAEAVAIEAAGEAVTPPGGHQAPASKAKRKR